jgi:superfamily II DNA or RNA helicase
VKEFQEGRIRVLTNYGVLTQGFDNPKVNVVYVTRPVFSAAAYLQMVGRGLRGPANGGTENCLIVDIDDNLENFPDLKLVYQTVNEWFDNDGNGDLPDDLEDIEDVV